MLECRDSKKRLTAGLPALAVAGRGLIPEATN